MLKLKTHSGFKNLFVYYLMLYKCICEEKKILSLAPLIRKWLVLSNLYSNIRGILYIKCAFINEQPVHYYLFHFNAESCKPMRNKIEFCGMKIHLTLFKKILSLAPLIRKWLVLQSEKHN
jgi:hypothetical protein